MRLFSSVAIMAILLLGVDCLCGQDQPPQGAPTSPPDQSSPAAQAPAQPAPAAPPTQSAPETDTQPAAPANPPAPAPKPKKEKSETKAATAGHKVVVRNGGAKDVSPQLAPGMTKEQEVHSRATTAQLLAATEANLKSIAARQLTAAQQNLLDQIHTYMRQSKEASDSDDLARAHTLAYKARLLSDELRK